MGGIVGSVGNLLGANPSQGSGFTAAGVPIVQPTTVDQANTAYGQTQQGIAAQQQLMQALQAQNGIQNQSNVFNQIQGVVNGQGPNPALATLNQATGQNVATQASLMAGQRGAGANVGLFARQAAQQGANLQQQAVGQGATMQANQSLNALGQLSGVAGQQVAQQTGAVQGYNAAAQGEQQNLLNSISAQNNANVGMQSNVNNANAGIAGINANNTAKSIGGITNAVGGAAAALMYQGGEVPNPKIATVDSQNRFPSKVLAPHLEHMAQIYHMDKYARGGKVNAMVSPGEVYLPPEKAKEVAKDGKNPIKEGEKIPGKAQVNGNSLKNDTVPKKLEAGGIVIPRDVLQSKNPAQAAAKFVTAHLKDHGDFKTALKEAIKNRKAS